MLSQTAEYAVRAVVYLGKESGASSTTEQIASATHLPSGYLAKVLRSLSRAKLVRSRPGRNGGFVLNRPVGKLTVLDVVNAVDPLKRIESCPRGDDFHRRSLCALHSHVNKAVDAANAAFAEITIDELMRLERRGKQQCEFPCLGPRV